MSDMPGIPVTVPLSLAGLRDLFEAWMPWLQRDEVKPWFLIVLAIASSVAAWLGTYLWRRFAVRPSSRMARRLILTPYLEHPKVLVAARRADVGRHYFGLPARVRGRALIAADEDGRALHAAILTAAGPEHPLIFLVGRGGAGKSTVLAHIALLTHSRALEAFSSLTLRPLWIRPDDYKDTFIDTITAVVARYGAPLDRPAVDEQLAAGGLLVLFDGLSAVRADQDKLLTELLHIARGTRYSRSRFIIATRPLTIDVPDDVPVVELEALRKDVVRDLISRFASSETAIARIERQLDAFNADAIDPLLFKMTVEAYGREASNTQGGDKVVRTPAELYEKYFAQLLNVSTSGLEWGGWKRLLENVAQAFLIESGSRGVGLAQDRTLELLTEKNDGKPSLLDELQYHGLLRGGGPRDLLDALLGARVLEQDDEHLKFCQNTFEEYFAASHTVTSLRRRVVPPLGAWKPSAAQALQEMLEFASQMVEDDESTIDVISDPDRLPVSWRGQAGVLVLLAFGAGLTSRHGFAHHSVGRVYQCALNVVAGTEDREAAFAALHGIFRFELLRGDVSDSLRTCQRLIEASEATGFHGWRLAARVARGSARYHAGDFARAWSDLKWCIEHDVGEATEGFALPAFLYSSVDLRIVARTYGAWARWALGYHLEAITLVNTAVDVAHRAGQRFGLAFAHILRAHLMNECVVDVAFANESARYATGASFAYDYWAAYATMLQGWANLRAGHAGEAGRRLADGSKRFADTEAGIHSAYFLALQAEAAREVGDLRSTETFISQAEALVTTNNRGEESHASEVYRIRGAIRRMSGDLVGAEHSFREAVDAARHRSAKAFELRAVNSLTSLLLEEGRSDEARAELIPLWQWFGQHAKVNEDDRWRRLPIGDLVTAEGQVRAFSEC